MKRFASLAIAAFLALFAQASSAVPTTYYASPTGSGTTCSAGSPCTITQCPTTAATGDICALLPGTYDLGSSGNNFSTKNITITSSTGVCGDVTITSSNSTRTVALSVVNNATPLILSYVTVANTAGSYAIAINDAAFDAEVDVIGTCSTAGTSRAINDSYGRGTVKLTNNSVTGNIPGGGAVVSSPTLTAAKKISVTGNTINVTSTSNTQTPVLQVARNTGSLFGEWAYIANNTITAVVPPAVGTNEALIGIRLTRITNGVDLSGNTTPPIIEGNTVSVTATGATIADTMAVLVESQDSTAVADNAIVRNNVLTCNSGVTRCVSVGNDSTTQNYATSVNIYGNTIAGLYYNGVATPHGVSCGHSTNCRVYRNWFQGHGAAILTSEGTNHEVFGNIVRGAAYACFLAKGNTSATFFGNSCVMDDSILGAHYGPYGCIEVASQSPGPVNNAATTFQNNICRVANGTGWKFVKSDTSQTATFINNDYYSDVALAGTQFTYGASNYAALANWQGAQESTALGLDPAWMGGSSPSLYTGFELGPSSGLIRKGQGLANGYGDYRACRYWSHAPSIGALEACGGAPAAPKTAK